MMEPNTTAAAAKPSSLRWKILRRALLQRSEGPSDIRLSQVSRKGRNGFKLIPFHVIDEEGQAGSLQKRRDACLCYELPSPNVAKLFLYRRVEDHADLYDFEVCNRYHIDNTGLVCQWPSEEVLAYFCLSNVDMFRGKRVIELGSGYGLAGLVIAMVTEALEVVISDGNPQVIDYIQHNIDANSAAFGGTEVKAMMLHWDHSVASTLCGAFDVIVASDCTFFKEFHKSLVQTIKSLLKEEGPSEAILFSPKRGDSLDKFLMEVKDSGLHYGITEIYDTEVWHHHQSFVNGNDSWPNYEKDHCYPLLVRLTR